VQPIQGFHVASAQAIFVVLAMSAPFLVSFS